MPPHLQKIQARLDVALQEPLERRDGRLAAVPRVGIHEESWDKVHAPITWQQWPATWINFMEASNEKI